MRQNVSADRAQLDPITVRIATPKQVRVPSEVMVSGTVETPSAPTSVRFLVSGKVIHVGTREGDSVKAGEVLAVVDPADFQFAEEAAIAESALAHAQNEKTRSGGIPASASKGPTAVYGSDGPLADEPNLRPPDPGFAHSAPHTSAPKSCWGKRMRPSKMLMLLWFFNCHMLPRRLIEFISVL